jgi:hypothetical protein
MVEALPFEQNFWGDCTNTFDEEQKHFVYGRLMGLERRGYSFDVGGARVVDIGGGPVSMLLKAINLRTGVVVDPLEVPDWVIQRYKAKAIAYVGFGGEEWISERTKSLPSFDEAWIYNCLQHTVDPEAVVANAMRAARLVRLFEWIDIPPHEGHPHMLTAAMLERWLGALGHMEQLAEAGCYGRSFSGVFRSP